MRNTIFALLALLPLTAMAAGEFVVRDMRVEGLQRISEGTVFNYLPINVGDTVDKVRIGEAIRALYAQDLFDDVEMRRDGDTLIVVVKERPSIESFNIEGNKDIKTEDLMESLRAVGLARGRTFNRSVLDNVEMLLREQYYDRGKYGVIITSTVSPLERNRVAVNIDIREGKTARIRRINIVGNEVFDDETLLDDAISDAVASSVDCHDTGPVDLRDARRELARYPRAARIKRFDWQYHACRYWDSGAAAADFRRPVVSDVPTLLLAGEFDPVTPAERASASPGSRGLMASRARTWGVIGSVISLPSAPSGPEISA